MSFSRAATVAAIASVVFTALAGCATTPDGPAVVALPYAKIFSKNKPGDEATLPDGWHRWTLSKFKKPTKYKLVDYNGRTVVKAQADASASGLLHRLDIDPREFPLLTWQWKTTGLITSANNRTRQFEDSPVRIVVTFAGDTNVLALDDRLFFDNVRLLTGQRMPYATLMYIWENKAPVNTVLPNLHTSRVKMIVAESGSKHVGQWREQMRNVLDDYRRAFGEEPARITSVAVMTDTDNTGESTLAYYGDIVFRRSAAR